MAFAKAHRICGTNSYAGNVDDTHAIWVVKSRERKEGRGDRGEGQRRGDIGLDE